MVAIVRTKVPQTPCQNPHKRRCRVCHIELSLETKSSLEILSHCRTDPHLVRENRFCIETPVLPSFGRDDVELVRIALDEARERAELEFAQPPNSGQCYLLHRVLALDTDVLDIDVLTLSYVPKCVVC